MCRDFSKSMARWWKLSFRIEIAAVENAELEAAVLARWNLLTKPPGSLGRLESLVTRLALMQNTAGPVVERKLMVICCADHGVTAEGVSAYPREVTVQMVQNFLRGGAAINVLCGQFGITPMIVDAGVDGEPVAGVVDCRIGRGTANFVEGPAMSRAEVEQALENGARLASEARDRFDVAAVGEMGIGNTTAASALLCAYAGVDPVHAVGPGTGVTAEGVARKANVIGRALARHRDVIAARDAVGILAAVGGFEIATMAGFLLGAAAVRLPIVIDGFISSTAALAAHAIDARVLEYLVFSHLSSETAHRRLLAWLGVQPLLDLELRLGEGSGAALAMPILDAAIALYSRMATFAEAGVAEV